VIAGFNTDVEHSGTVYHVQTEDKGVPARVIMSLVYHKGTILASKRVNYDDLEADELSEKKLAARVSRQHKLICAAVQAGRIDDLKEMTAQTAAGAKKKKAAPAVVVETVSPAVPAAAAPVAHTAANGMPPPIPAPSLDPFANVPVIEIDGIFEEEVILPADAVEVVSELSGRERPAHNKLSLELLGESKFKGGDRRTVSVMVCRGSDRKVVAKAQIMIKVLGSSFRPVIFHAKSDPNGLAKVHLQLPHFQAGRAALLVRAIFDGEEVELRRVVTSG
jgi:hypothetical protein